MSTILIYRDILLPPSETFIKEQGEFLRDYKALYVGMKKVEGIELPINKTFLINNGTIGGAVRKLGLKIFRKDIGITSILRKCDPALLHAHFGPDGLTALPLARRLDIPLVITFHGFDATVNDEWGRVSSSFSFKRFIKNRHLLQQPDIHYVAVSKFIMNKMIERGFSQERIYQLYTGININTFTPTSEVKRAPVILFVGRLVEKKGCTYLIKAMSEVQKRMPDMELVIIGDGPLRPALEAEAKQSLQRYSFLGFQPHNVVKQWMNRAKLFCVPSVAAANGDSEGFGMVFAEASAMGVPIVSFRSGGIPEAVLHGTSGLLAKERDHYELAECILTLLENEELWNQISEAGQQRVREQFNIEKQSRKLEEHYSLLIKKYKKRW